MMATYFSGFGLCNEWEVFSHLQHSKIIEINRVYDIIAFNYGAQRAIDYAISTTKRIRKISLLSPAFFHDKNPIFKEQQLKLFKSHPQKYIHNFYPTSPIALSSFIYTPSVEELKKMIYYFFSPKDLLYLQQRNIIIEIFLGQKDTLINIQAAFDFFYPLSQRIFIFQNAGHFLV